MKINRITKNGHVIVQEENHRKVFSPIDELPSEIQVLVDDHPDKKYRTQENADAYEAKLLADQPTEAEQLEQWRQTAKLPSRKFWLGVEFYPYNGGFMLDAINSAIQGLQGQTKKKVSIELERTHEFNRNAPSTLMMIQAIGMTAEEADAFFIWAENEEWDNL